ncbi:Plant invertase/pectin methylesterase inhibitor superfamily protein [Rhynchospora pubera]|uniref:Plant invertase/pectin methylesterase inhibitor superfamily protein n=1 Tax=Rhynchospora pubera TaxID=906938 RepID=A0AAV8FRT2_9POAL|nr:Plant invertase/pectin methylesterase inhibitor superfamily protein [Rhynchospora pubera]KAJ4796219.1 Plant invertase/pectin methylesterase inhibitor superfamily protein [Rhynchospora pubera]
MASISLFLSLLLVYWSMAMASTDQASTSFIRTSCSRTLYADLCYSSLSPYASQVGHDPVLLARFAMNVTVGSLKPLSSYIASALRRTPSSSSDQELAALKDCSELISDATDQVKKSEREVTGLEGLVGTQVTWRIGNAQTWLSAAITDENTCMDGFGDGSGGAGEDVEMEVRQKVKRAEQHSSISLALVNGLVKHR